MLNGGIFMNKLGMLGTLVATAALALGCGEKGGHGVRGPEHMNLGFETKEGIRYSFGLNRYSNRVAVLDASLRESELRFNEGEEISPGDSIVVNNDATDFTHVLRFDGLDSVHKSAKWTDYTGQQRAAIYANGQGQITIAGASHGFLVIDEARGRIRMDLDGNHAVQDRDESRITARDTSNPAGTRYIFRQDLLLP